MNAFLDSSINNPDYYFSKNLAGSFIQGNVSLQDIFNACAGATEQDDSNFILYLVPAADSDGNGTLVPALTSDGETDNGWETGSTSANFGNFVTVESYYSPN